MKLCLSDNPRTRPLLDGRVRLPGDWQVETLHPSEMFWRQLHHAEFDVCEMSLASLMIVTARGDTRFVALPVFTMRRVFHTGVLVRGGIATPRDLEGRRVGVPEYQQSSAIWTRGVLAERFGVDLASIEWWMERGADVSHGAATGFVPPPGVRLHRIPRETDIGAMMLAGELDATLLYLREPNAVDRSRADLDASPLIRRLFGADEARAYVADMGFVPVNHVLVAKREVLTPALARELLAAFTRARDLAGEPGYPYGLRPNRAALETLARHVHDQGLTARRVAPADIFEESAHAEAG